MDIKNSFFKLIFCITLLLSQITPVYALSELAHFYRCYSHITGTYPSDSDPYVQQVKDYIQKIPGGKNAVDSCMDLFTEANLNAVTGEIKKVDENYSETGINIVRNFHNLHIALFQTDAQIKSDRFDYLATDDYLNPNEAALYLTRSLLREDIPLSNILTENKPLRAIRNESRVIEGVEDLMVFKYILKNFTEPESHTISYQSNRTYIDSKEETTYATISFPTQRFGKIVGINFDSNKMTIPGYHNGRVRLDGTVKKSAYDYLQPKAYDINQNHGGGVLGTNAFILKNWGQSAYVYIDGGFHTARRLGKAIYKKIMGLELPVIYEQDANDFVDTDSPYPFVNGRSCMQCHASMDRIAYVYRDIKFVASTGPYAGKVTKNDKIHFAARYIAGVNFDEVKAGNPGPEAAPWPVDDVLFQHRPTNGTLYYRNWNGELVNKVASSRQNLGELIAQEDDFYIHIANIYFKFFTGIEVNVANLTLKPITDDEFKNKKLAYRNLVIRLGLELKNEIKEGKENPGQSLQELIRKIINSEAYKSPGKGV